MKDFNLMGTYAGVVIASVYLVMGLLSLVLSDKVASLLAPEQRRGLTLKKQASKDAIRRMGIVLLFESGIFLVAAVLSYQVSMWCMIGAGIIWLSMLPLYTKTVG
ncbi:MAG: hypothetical protein PWP24_1680 [Clostridiales bacterium]|nr:hypothetical protein [Clostridiales bacterium]